MVSFENEGMHEGESLILTRFDQESPSGARVCLGAVGRACHDSRPYTTLRCLARIGGELRIEGRALMGARTIYYRVCVEHASHVAGVSDSPLTLEQPGHAHLYEVIQPILTRAQRIIASQC